MRTDSGMTLLEIMVALTILLIGVGFVLKSNTVSYHYRDYNQTQQQLLFYGAGILESKLIGESVTSEEAPFSNFTVTENINDVTGDPDVNGYLEQIEITVEESSSEGTYPVKFMTYRVKL